MDAHSPKMLTAGGALAGSMQEALRELREPPSKAAVTYTGHEVETQILGRFHTQMEQPEL